MREIWLTAAATNFDCFHFGASAPFHFIVSEKLKNQLAAAQITGTEIKEVDWIFAE